MQNIYMPNVVYFSTNVNNISIKFLKHVLKHRESIRNLRYYLIAKNHFYNRSGIFKPEELLDILSHDLKSLKDPANRYRYKIKLKNTSLPYT